MIIGRFVTCLLKDRLAIHIFFFIFSEKYATIQTSSLLMFACFMLRRSTLFLPFEICLLQFRS
jgi:hypothetical protein